MENECCTFCGVYLKTKYFIFDVQTCKICQIKIFKNFNSIYNEYYDKLYYEIPRFNINLLLY